MEIDEGAGGTVLRVDVDGRLEFSEHFRDAFLKTFHGKGELWFSKDETSMEENMWDEFKKNIQTFIEEHS